MEKISLRLFLPLLFLIGLSYNIQAQTIRFVKQGGSGDGSSWANASGDFQAMINVSVAGDEVWVAAGDYQTPGTAFSMKEGVRLYGGFPNSGTPVWANRNYTANTSRLLGITNNNSGNRVIENNSPLTMAALLDGFTIANGYASGLSHGGGIFNNGASPAISNCFFTENQAGQNGGALFNVNASPVLTNCTFLNNRGGFVYNGKGGAVANSSGTPIFTNCIFQNNKVLLGGNGTGGGGMFNNGTSPVLTNCKFYGNTAYDGGALFNEDASPIITNAEFSGNSAIVGGAVYTYGSSSPLFKNCSFQNNSAHNGGAIAVYYYAQSILENCVVVGNTALGNSGNGMGGGIYSKWSRCTITSSTITDNTASLDGGAIYGEEPFNAPGFELIIHNSIVYGNNTGIGLYKNKLQSRNNLLQEVTGSFQVTVDKANTIEGQDPLFVNAANPKGADGVWGTADDGLRLQSTSPAVNTGSNSLIPAGVVSDFAGAARIQRSTVDQGAYESAHMRCEEISNIIYVDAAVAQSGNGGSWGHAFKTLAEAFALLDACTAVNTIMVAEGTYFPSGSGDRDASFLLPRRGNLKIYGGYSSGGSNRNATIYKTILSGDIGTASDMADNSYHIMVIANIDAAADSVVIDGLTFTQANGSDGGIVTLNNVAVSRNTGGGICLVNNNGNSRIHIRDCSITGNSAWQGAGIFCSASSPYILNTRLQGNNAGDNGGGISNYNASQPVLMNVLIAGNRAVFAGAVFNDNSSPVFINATIAGNLAVSDAGGFYNRIGITNVSFRNSVIYGNRNGAGNISNIFNTQGGQSGFTNSLIETASGAWEPALGTDNGNNLFADPVFAGSVIPATGNTPNTSGNYQAQAGSPLVDAGNSALLPAGINVDITGAVRQQQASVDIGAYESPFFNCNNFKTDNTKTDVLCHGASTGIASVSVLQGTAPYSYAWSNGASVATISNVTAGDYTVTITDANGCTALKTISIQQPAAPLDAAGISTDVKCYGESNGTASFTATGGQAPYQYSWSTGSTTADISSLLPGVYTCIITDANGCSVTRSVTIVQPAAALSLNITQTDISCHGQSDGAAQAIASGGTAPYTYEWSNNQVISSITGLGTGDYTCTVTDANGCAVSRTISILQPAALSVTSNIKNSCWGSSNGRIELAVAGGTTPYSFNWSNGQTGNWIDGLAAGNYSCIIKDAANCELTTVVTVTEPAMALTITSTYTEKICYNSSTGTATVTADGGTAPYSYQWSNGATTATVSDLVAGVYSCVISDAAGCTETKTFTIAQPAAALTAGGSVMSVSCYNGNTGTATVAPSGGNAPYSYLWSTGSTDISVSDLTAGTYSCTITDATGCTVVKDLTITEPASLLSATIAKTDITCFNAANGNATVTATGGTSPYTYAWSNGANSAMTDQLVAGNYICTITDARGCAVVVQATINEPAALQLSMQKGDVDCNGENNGTAAANVSGGTAPYSYQWSTGNSGTDISGQVAGTYTCTITDSRGCTVTGFVTITQPDPLVLDLSQTNVLCHGASTGSATATVTGGVLPYTYNWSNGGAGTVVNNLVAGAYQIEVKDANGCAADQLFTVTEPAAFSAQILMVKDIYCGSGNNGMSLVQGTGGITPYTYLWSNSGTASLVQGLTAGNHSCILTDANGCTVTASITIKDQAFSGNKIYVDSAVAVAGDGSSWVQAFRNLSDALNVASACVGVDSILVAKGTYKPVDGVLNSDRDNSFLVRQSGGLKLYGGYPSGGGLRNIETNTTILSGEIGVDWNNADNSSHVMLIAGLSAGADSVVIDGFTVTRGYAVGAGTFNYNGVEVPRNGGGGLSLVNNTIDAGKIAIRNCAFTDNFTFSSGGAIYSEQSSPAIIASRFSRNIGVNGAGAILNLNSSNSFIALCEFSENEGDAGGAIHNSQNSHARIDQCRFLGNAASMGGAITNENSAPTITNSFIAGNRAYTIFGGGGIFNKNASPVIINTHFIKNVTQNGYGGGLSNFFGSSPKVINCNIYINEGWSWTGGIYNDGSHLTITNSIVYGNTGGITNMNGSTTSASYSLLEYWTGGGTGNLNATLDPMFAAPAYNAPYTQGDYRLQPCSPAINAGTADTTGLSLPLLETTGLPRVQLGRIDIGPTEANSYTNENAAALPVTATSTAAWQLSNGTTWYAADCQTLIAAVRGSGTHPVSGNTTVSVDMDVTLLPGTVSRVYEITPDNNATTASGTITLYFTQAEFTAYNNANTGNNKLPLPDKDDPQMNDDLGNIRIRKVSGGLSTIITTSAVNWNAGLERWEITFDVSGFSKFYLFTPDNTSLPLRLLSFDVRAENCTARSSWRTTEESGVAGYELEHSIDGQTWGTVSAIDARNIAGEQVYQTNVSINSSLNFYRLKMVDMDGTVTYSKIVRLIAPLNCSSQHLKLYPNPVMDILYIEKVNPGDLYTVYDNAGRILLQGTVSKTIQEIKVSRLVMGTYMITVANKQGAVKALKFVKK